jgi:hypothetical protein
MVGGEACSTELGRVVEPGAGGADGVVSGWIEGGGVAGCVAGTVVGGAAAMALPAGADVADPQGAAKVVGDPILVFSAGTPVVVGTNPPPDRGPGCDPDAAP